MNFGERIKTLRKEKKITQQELAEAIGLSKGTVAMWEVGKREASFDTLNKLSDYFEVSIDYLLGRHSDSSRKTYLNEEIHSFIGWTTDEMVELMENLKYLDEDHISMVAVSIREAYRQCIKNKTAKDYYPCIHISI